jgi:putative molybdopterin biosynthesis protein
MHQVQFSYLLAAERGKDALIRNPLLDMLQAVREHGSIARGARALDLSYRSVWGSLKNWEEKLGRELIVWDKGQRAQLTDFGEKLLWAERQAQARLAPQIEALRVDIERAFSTAFDDSAHLLTLYASHDAALSMLRDHTRQHKLHLDIRFMGSVDAITALNAGRCMMAGFHTLDQPGSHSVAARTYRSLLKPGLHKLIGFAHRAQGLIVAKGNPYRLAGLADLARPGLRYVNRAEGTGTRVLLEELLAGAGVAASAVNGYDTQEPSHAAVAQAVASGSADAGLGIEAAAREKGLDFVPVIEERYHLVCLKSELTTPRVQALLDILQSPAWRAALDELPGYAISQAQSGAVLAMRSVLPWWNYKTAKKRWKNPVFQGKSACSPNESGRR